MKRGPITVPSSTNADAVWRTWVQAIHDTLVACNLIQTADTGQINLATCTKPAANAVSGYEIWRFSDALQATAPIFVKIEYITFGDGTQPGVMMTVGMATDGAGNITGALIGARRTCAQFATFAVGTTSSLYAGGDANTFGGFWVLTNAIPGTTSAGFCFGVERTRGEDGQPTGDGVISWCVYSSTQSWQVGPFTGVQPGAKTTSPTLDPNSFGRAVQGTQVAVAPMFYFIGRPFYMLCCVCTYLDSVPSQTQFSTTHLGASHTFISSHNLLTPGTGSGVMDWLFE